MPFPLDSLAPTVRVGLKHPITQAPLDDAALVLHAPYTADARNLFLDGIDQEVTNGEPETLRAALAAQDAQILALTVAVEGLELNGEPVTVANLPSVAATFPWILRQGFAGYAEIGSFFGVPKATSSPSPDTSGSSTAP